VIYHVYYLELAVSIIEILSFQTETFILLKITKLFEKCKITFSVFISRS